MKLATKRKKHLYNSKITKVIFFIRQFGLSQLFMKPIRSLFAPLMVLLLNPTQFKFDNQDMKMVYHAYNTTWANERCVEIPIMLSILRKNKKKYVLEIGNVLSHYFKSSWDVLDKFEKGEGIINKDIVDYNPDKKYDIVVSVSTFEHIGYDDSEGDSKNKILLAFTHVIKNCISINGLFIMTAPIGYNPAMDSLIRENAFGFNKAFFIKRFSKRAWKEVSQEEALLCKYGKPFPYANAIMIGFYSPCRKL